MVFLNPIFLWTLLGLSIPIAIHFWSKKKVKTIKIGSTQLLKELNPKQTSSIRLNQWFLLLLRMMIIGLIALILSGTRIEFVKSERNITYLVEPSLLALEKVQVMLDTIEEDHVRLLVPEFPLLDEKDATDQSAFIPDYWQLSQEMKNLEADSIIVFSKGLVQGFKGMRPSIDLPIQWLIFDSGEIALTPIEVVRSKEQFTVTSLKSDPSILQYEYSNYALDEDILTIENKSDSVYYKNNNETIKMPLLQQKTSHILIVSDAQFYAEKIYIVSALNALSKYLNQDLQLRTVEDIKGIDLSSFDLLIWLNQKEMIPFKGKKLQWQPDDLAHDLIEIGTSKEHYFLRNHLNAENSVSMNLPRQLIPLMEPDHRLPENIESLDLRTMDLQEIKVNQNDSKSIERPKQQKDISNWLWTLLLLVLPLERIVSKYKKQ